jgi:hypothetical protein
VGPYLALKGNPEKDNKLTSNIAALREETEESSDKGNILDWDQNSCIYSSISVSSESKVEIDKKLPENSHNACHCFRHMHMESEESGVDSSASGVDSDASGVDSDASGVDDDSSADGVGDCAR